VRAGLVNRPEEWPFGGEIFYDEAGGPRLVRGTPPLLETGILIGESGMPCESTRPKMDASSQPPVLSDGSKVKGAANATSGGAAYNSASTGVGRAPSSHGVHEEPPPIPSVEIYTDGGCEPNPGPGGYGVVLLYPRKRAEASGGFRLTTNNRMEILAAINGLEMLKQPCRVTLYSDSQYVVDAMTKGWVQSWERKQWWHSKTERVPNRDLWERLMQLCKTHQVDFRWVRGHAGNPEMSDAISFLRPRCDSPTCRLTKAMKIDLNLTASDLICGRVMHAQNVQHRSSNKLQTKNRRAIFITIIISGAPNARRPT
jgi:ribonuclease HI